MSVPVLVMKCDRVYKNEIYFKHLTQIFKLRILASLLVELHVF